MPKGDQFLNAIYPIVAVIVVAYLIYMVLKSQGLITEKPPTSSRTTPECPQGEKYTRGLFGTCDPNYVSAGKLWNDECVCLPTVV